MLLVWEFEEVLLQYDELANVKGLFPVEWFIFELL